MDGYRSAMLEIHKQIRGKRQSEKDREARKRQIRKDRIMDLFEEGIEVKEISERLGISENTIKRTLGKRRLEEAQGVSAFLNTEETESDTGDAKYFGKLTTKRADELVQARNARIQVLYAEGMSIEEIATKEYLTPDQIKEIYFSLGLRLDRKEPSQEGNRRKIRETQRRKTRNRTGVKEGKVISYQDIKGKIGEYINQGNSKRALEFARQFTDADFLSSEERSRISAMVEYIEAERSKFAERKSKEGQSR